MNNRFTGWIKHLKDKEAIKGSDIDIKNKTASWSKSCLDNITAVSIWQNGLFVSSLENKLYNTEWHQFDRYQLSSSENIPKRIFRAVQFNITEELVGCFISHKIGRTNIFSIIPKTSCNTPKIFKILDHHVDKWLTLLVYPDFSNKLLLTNKGKYDGTSII
jgi:hypothetical protein